MPHFDLYKLHASSPGSVGPLKPPQSLNPPVIKLRGKVKLSDAFLYTTFFRPYGLFKLYFLTSTCKVIIKYVFKLSSGRVKLGIKLVEVKLLKLLLRSRRRVDTIEGSRRRDLFSPAIFSRSRSLTESIKVLDGHATFGEPRVGEIRRLPSAERRMIADKDG